MRKTHPRPIHTTHTPGACVPHATPASRAGGRDAFKKGDVHSGADAKAAGEGTREARRGAERTGGSWLCWQDERKQEGIQRAPAAGPSRGTCSAGLNPGHPVPSPSDASQSPRAAASEPEQPGQGPAHLQRKGCRQRSGPGRSRAAERAEVVTRVRVLQASRRAWVLLSPVRKSDRGHAAC